MKQKRTKEGLAENEYAPLSLPRGTKVAATNRSLDGQDNVIELRDVRRKRPPALSLLLRFDTLRRSIRILLLVAIDCGGIFLAIFLALSVKSSWYNSWDFDKILASTRSITPFASLITVLLFARSNLYAGRTERAGFTRVISSLSQVMLVTLIFALIDGQRFSSYYIFYGSLLFSLITVSVLRFTFNSLAGWLLRAAGYRRRTVLVGTDSHIDSVAHALSKEAHTKIEVVGFISLTAREDNGLRSLGSFDQLDEVLSENTIDEIIIADPAFPEKEMVELVDICHQRGVRVRVAPSTMEVLIHRAELVPGETLPLFELKPPVFEGVDFALKRVFDVTGSLLLLIMLSPIFLLICLLVWVTSTGPIFYRSFRPGIGGIPFPCLKFRTMYSDADRRQSELESSNEASGALFKIRNDPRVTPIGRFLRRFSFDELPQLINVLRGEMSLVGPRPLPKRDFDRLEEWHKKRYLVLPGITGLWQVSGRSDLEFDDLVRLDFLYLERWSVFLDLTIVLKTLPAVLMRRGAY